MVQLSTATNNNNKNDNISFDINFWCFQLTIEHKTTASIIVNPTSLKFFVVYVSTETEICIFRVIYVSEISSNNNGYNRDTRYTINKQSLDVL